MSDAGRFRLALVGAESLRGKEIRNVFGARDFPVLSFEFYDPDVEEEFSRLTEFRDEPKVVHHLEPRLLEGLDLVLLAADPETSRACGELALTGAFRAIDLNGVFGRRADVPVVVAGVNDGLLRTSKPALVSGPHPVTILLSHLLAAVRRKHGLVRSLAVALQPASAFEAAGVQELIDQSCALLAGEKLPRRLFREQAAFNLLPRAEKAGPDGFTAAEKRVRDEVRRVLEAPALPLSVSFVQAPVFHAYGVMVHLETERDAGLKDLSAALASDPVFRLEPPEGAKSAGPAAVVGKDEIYVGAVKRDASEPRDFWVWLAADNLTAGAALNTLAVARALCGADGAPCATS